MDIRKTVIMMCAATCIGTTTLFAQTERELPAPGKEHFKAMPLSPEKRAKRIVNQMDSLLNLTQKQYDKLYKSYLKHEKQVEKNRWQGAMPPMMGGPGRGPGMNPPQGGGFGQPPHGMGMPPFGMESAKDLRTKEEKQRKKLEKKIKKILTPEQYELWQKEGEYLMPIQGKPWEAPGPVIPPGIPENGFAE